MSEEIDDIMGILRECHPTEFLKVGESPWEMYKNDTLANIKSDIQKFLSDSRCNMSSIEYANLNKLLALSDLQMGCEASAVNHLIESHAVILRQQILHRYMKMEMRESILNLPQAYGLNSKHIAFNAKNIEENNDALMTKLAELPKEWYMIQVTEQYKSFDSSLQYTKSSQSRMHPLHITYLPTGQNDMQPFCISLPTPATDTGYDICDEIQKILSTNKSDLDATYANSELYWKMRERQNNKMQVAIQNLERIWLREWRILFMADLLENLELENYLYQMIDKLIFDCHAFNSISNCTKWLLKKIVIGSCFLNREEIARAVTYVLSDHKKLAENIILSIYGQLTCIKELRKAKRKTLILIIDENIDYIPFESMEIFKDHPVTRFPSFHIAYALFKEHESTIHNGCKLIEKKSNLGTCIVNPAGDLHKMEKRIRLFINYWLPHWNALYNVHPEEKDVENALVNQEILMYNGHGSGMQYLSGEQIEKLKVKSIVLLFGCSSLKLAAVGGRYPPNGVSNKYLIASSPCILGMLWEVTDGDIDRMTTDFLSTWIPSTASQPWNTVDIKKWCSGSLKFAKQQKTEYKASMEPEMLRAVAMSKNVCTQYMTSAAIITRGLPVKLV